MKKKNKKNDMANIEHLADVVLTALAKYEQPADVIALVGVGIAAAAIRMTRSEYSELVAEDMKHRMIRMMMSI